MALTFNAIISKKRSQEVRIALIYIGILGTLSVMLDVLMHTISQTIPLVRLTSNILLGMALGIYLTLKIFGRTKEIY